MADTEEIQYQWYAETGLESGIDGRRGTKGEKRFEEACHIIKPFQQRHIQDNEWCSPCSSLTKENRQKQFEWDRPRINRQKLVETVARYQAEELQRQLRQKDIEIRLMVKQLLRTNKENVHLLNELEGRKKYEDLYNRHEILKHQFSRKSMENIILAGKLRQANNRLLHKLTK